MKKKMSINYEILKEAASQIPTIFMNCFCLLNIHHTYINYGMSATYNISNLLLSEITLTIIASGYRVMLINKTCH